MKTSMNRLERFEYGLSELEKGLNVIDYIPFANILSSGIRMALGQAQLITGLAIGCFSLIGRELSKDDTKKKRFHAVAEHGFEHAKHGLANIFRAIVVSEFSSYLGGLATYIFYDLHKYRVKYAGEEKAKELLGSEDSPSFLSAISEQLRLLN